MLKKGSDPIYKRLESLYPDGAERDKATGDLSQALKKAKPNITTEKRGQERAPF